MKTRTQALVIARSWAHPRTPYVMAGRIKGAGCDCATLLSEYLIEIGAATEQEMVDIGFYKGVGLSHGYSPDWFCHTGTQAYLRGLMKFGKLVAETVCRKCEHPQPGDLVLFRAVKSRIYNHGAIVTRWPFGIHAQYDGVREVDLSSNIITAYRPMDIFDPFEGRP